MKKQSKKMKHEMSMILHNLKKMVKNKNTKEMTLDELADFYTEKILLLLMTPSNEIDVSTKRLMVQAYIQTLLNKQEMELTGTCEIYIEGLE